MSETPEDYELFHYGTKGMKWGVRKDRGGSGGGSVYTKVKKKIADRDKSILDARQKLREADAEGKAIASGLRAKKQGFKESGLTRKEVRSEYKKAKTDVAAVRKAAAKKWADNYTRASSKTTREILISTALGAGTAVVPSMSYAMASTKASRINNKTARYFAEAYRQSAPQPRNALPAPNTIVGEVVR